MKTENVIGVVVVILVMLLYLVGCNGNVEPRAARRALEAQGLKSVQITGYSFFGCARGDSYSSRFRAIGANDKMVTGVVCSGWFKGVTVRYD